MADVVLADARASLYHQVIALTLEDGVDVFGDRHAVAVVFRNKSDTRSE